MGFSEAVRTSLSKYVTFSGRAPRPEYWYFFLFLFLASLVGSVVDMVLFGPADLPEDGQPASGNGPVQSLIGLALFLPHLAVTWRRMHDSGRSGLYAFFPLLLMLAAVGFIIFGIGLASLFNGGTMDKILTDTTLLILIPTLIVALVSPLLVLWWLCQPSQPGTNQYGPNPYEVSQ